MRKRLLLALILSIIFFYSGNNIVSAQGKRLEGARLTSCQAREEAVKNRMKSLLNLVTNMESKFDSIATRVQTFYSEKILPTGKIVPNYDALVSNINAKKDLVTKEVENTKADMDKFSCQVENPKGLLTDFRLNMQAVKAALKNYRTSIKNLIVAIHRVSPTPEPSVTPTGSPNE